VKPKKWDVQKLQENKEIQQNYQTKIEEKIREYKEEGNVEGNWDRIEKIIKEAADETVSREGNQGNKEWFDEECAKVVLEKNNARKRMLQRETRINCVRYQELRREVNRICKQKKKESMKRQLEEVNKFKNQNELIRLTRMTMSTTQAQIKIDNKLSTKFEFNAGVKQGDGLSAVLFIVALYSVIKTIDQRGTVFTKSSQICAYVDDIVIIVTSREKITDIYKKMQEKPGKIVLEVNERKTKYMIM
jgi:hypothetical protein